MTTQTSSGFAFPPPPPVPSTVAVSSLPQLFRLCRGLLLSRRSRFPPSTVVTQGFPPFLAATYPRSRSLLFLDWWIRIQQGSLLGRWETRLGRQLSLSNWTWVVCLLFPRVST